MQLSAGTHLDRYVVVGPLGQGGMAHVVLVRHQRLGTLHALKILHGGSPRLRARLLREGQVQGNLRHTNVLSVTDVIDVDGAPGLVMEYVDGPDLAQLLQAHRLTQEEADALARPILDGVVAAHRAGLVHRDLKPANVLIAVEDERLVPKVADFGLAKVLVDEDSGANQTRSGMAMGTPAYMAPEQVRDASRVDARADVFALGCILYELVSGRTTFKAQDSFEILRKVVDGDFEDVRSVAPGLDDAMVDAIHGALVADPEARIASAEALRAAWIGDRADPRPDWPSLVRRAREIGREAPPAGTWSGGANQTWTGTIGADSPLPTVVPTLEPTQPTPEPRRSWLGPVLGLGGLVLVGAAAIVFSREAAEPELPVDPVLTSTSVVQVVDDPVLQAQFEEGWKAFLDADFRTAERKLEQVAAADPADPLLWFVLAQTRLSRGDVGDGIQAIWTGVERAQTFDSPFAELVPHMARTAIAEGWEGEHGQAVFDYLEAHPTDYFIPLLPLYSPASVGAPDWVTERVYATALARDPDPAVLYALRASGLADQGHWDQAISVAEEGLARSPGNPELLAREGNARMNAGEFAAARAALMAATQADPGLTQARIDLGLTALVTGDTALFEEVDQSLSGATTPPEQRATWAIHLAWTQLGRGEHDAALKTLAAAEQAARDADDWPMVFELSGQQGEIYKLFRELDRYEAALGRLREATAAPELTAENRQRLTEIVLIGDGWLAAARGDLDEAHKLRDRLAALPQANPRNVAAVDHQIAVAEKNPAGLRPDVFEPMTCRHALILALDRARAGADPQEGLPPVDELGCSAVGADPALLAMVRDASGGP